MLGFLFQDSVGEPEENEEKTVNLELVFGFHLKPGTGPQVSHSLNLFWITSNLMCSFYLSWNSVVLYIPLPAGNLTLSKFIDFIK